MLGRMVEWFSQPRTFGRVDDYPLNLDTSIRRRGDPKVAQPTLCAQAYRGLDYVNPFRPDLAALNYYAKPEIRVPPGGWQMPPLMPLVEFPIPKVR